MTSPKRSGDIQHQAEHTSTHHMSVAGYMLILFVVAFLLLLMAFFQQQRASDDTIEGLEQKSTSALASVQDIMAERDKLKEDLTALEQRLADANETIQQRENALSSAAEREAALQRLNQVRALYNHGHYADAAALCKLEDSAAVEALLQEISSSLPQEEREIYDPYEAYQLLKGWLNVE